VLDHAIATADMSVH